MTHPHIIPKYAFLSSTEIKRCLYPTDFHSMKEDVPL